MFIDEDDLVSKDTVVDKLEYVRKWNEQSAKSQAAFDDRKRNSGDSSKEDSRADNQLDKGFNVKEVNNNKIKDKLNKFEHFGNESESDHKKTREKRIIPVVEKDGLKGKVQLFEKEIQEQEAGKTESAALQTPKSKAEVMLFSSLIH